MTRGAASCVAASLLLLGAAAACGGRPAASATARGAEELLAPWIAVELGAPIAGLRAARPGLEPSGYASGTRAVFLDASDPAAPVLEVETDAGNVRVVGLEWKGPAADAAERELRRHLPAPRECSTLHESVEDYKTLLWKLPDGASASAMRKGKTWRVTVSRPPADGFLALYDSCARP